MTSPAVVADVVALDLGLIVQVVLRSTLVLLGTGLVLILLRRGSARRRSLLLALASLALLAVLALSVWGSHGAWGGLRLQLPVAEPLEMAPAGAASEPLDSNQVATSLDGSNEMGCTRDCENEVATVGTALVNRPPLTQRSINSSPVDLQGAERPEAAGSALSNSQFVWSKGSLVFGIWGLGFVFLLVRLMMGMSRLQRLADGSIEAPPAMKATLQRLSDDRHDPLRAGHRAPQCSHDTGPGPQVRLLLNTDCGVPMTWGVRSRHLQPPTILLPRRALNWSDQRLEVVLQHELGHIARGDWAVRMGVRLVRSLYWWHPLVHWASVRLELEQELACDEWVAERVRPSRYAQHLLSLHDDLCEPRPLAHALALPMLSKRQLERRMMNILDPSVLRKSAGRTALLLALCFVFLVAAVQPEVVRRSVLPAEVASERVEPSHPVPAVAAPAVAPQTRYPQTRYRVAPSAPAAPTAPERGWRLAPRVPVPAAEPALPRTPGPQTEWLPSSQLPARVAPSAPAPSAPSARWLQPVAPAALAPQPAVLPAWPARLSHSPPVAVAPQVPAPAALSPSSPRVARTPIAPVAPVVAQARNTGQFTVEEKERAEELALRVAELSARLEQLRTSTARERVQMAKQSQELRNSSERQRRDLARERETVQRRLSEEKNSAQRAYELELRALQAGQSARVREIAKSMEVEREALQRELEMVARSAKSAKQRQLQRAEVQERLQLRSQKLEQQARAVQREAEEARLKLVRELETRVSPKGDRATQAEREMLERLAAVSREREQAMEALSKRLEPRQLEVEKVARELERAHRDLARLQELALARRARVPRASARSVPVRPATPLALRRTDPGLRAAIADVLSEEAIALRLTEEQVARAAERVRQVLSTNRRISRHNGVGEDRLFVVGSPAEVRERLSDAWSEGLAEAAGTELGASMKAAIQRLGYELLEIRLDSN